MTDIQRPETRDILLDLIASNPGLYKTEICKQTGLGWGTLTYHLEVLEERGLIARHGSGKQVHFFPAKTPRSEMQWVSMLRRDLSRRILHNLDKNGPSQMYEIAQDLGTSRKMIRRHLTFLEREGVVRRRGATRPQYGVLAEFRERLRRTR